MVYSKFCESRSITISCGIATISGVIQLPPIHQASIDVQQSVAFSMSFSAFVAFMVFRDEKHCPSLVVT